MTPPAQRRAQPAIAPVAWPAVRAARSHDPLTRLPVYWRDPRAQPQGVEVGSVAHAHLPALARWNRWLHVDAQRVALAMPTEALADALGEMNAALRAEGCAL